MDQSVAEEFADWWDEVRFQDPWFQWGVAASFARWWAPRGTELTEEMEEDILDELEDRGMIYTDPWDWLDDDGSPSNDDGISPAPARAA